MEGGMQTNELNDTIKNAINTALSNFHTCTIAKVTKVNQKTINCRGVINWKFNGQEYEFPELVDVPPIFLSGGQSYEAYPLSVGDYCLLFFTERCFDAWYVGNDFVAPPEFRLGDYSDAFALVGIQNMQNAIQIPSKITQIGNKKIEGDLEHLGNKNQTGNLQIEGQQSLTLDLQVGQNMEAKTYSVDGESGASGTFTSKDDKTITVKNGIITKIQ